MAHTGSWGSIYWTFIFNESPINPVFLNQKLPTRWARKLMTCLCNTVKKWFCGNLDYLPAHLYSSFSFPHCSGLGFCGPTDFGLGQMTRFNGMGEKEMCASEVPAIHCEKCLSIRGPEWLQVELIWTLSMAWRQAQPANCVNQNHPAKNRQILGY